MESLRSPRSAPRARTAASASALLLAVSLCAVLPTPAAADTTKFAGACGGSTPVGVWDATVDVPDNRHRATLSFAADGGAHLTLGGPGEVSGSGSGTWWPTARDRFSFGIRHGLYDPQGTFLGSVEVNQRARQVLDTFTGSGVSLIFAPDGTRTGSATAEVSATRTGSPPRARLERCGER
ncbi:hypothetical protein ADK37_27770 [Streptomyces resistomycificus]|uniref:Uncharacterized protein n=2 Tax=Streptomyces resistomycificus TaxID=67356 RepID=A0A0L8L2J6_9ACTN|nr:hypothetical protein ADK37_27770 [Streptomyces resistomycificus]